MKFANYYHKNNGYTNIGDQIQILVFDYIYQQMGIAKKDIVYIEKTADYDGEPVILPVNMPLGDYFEHGFAERFSPQITPVFLGLTLLPERLSQEDVEYLRRYEPIGCRDERTFRIVQSHGIKAYLGGCATAVLPRRTLDENGRNRKIFLIDPPKKLKPFVPPEILQNATSCTHILFDTQRETKEIAIERYRQYADEASLVITALLHAASPCMAMGIPVILARDSVSYRYGWIEKFLHIYTPDEYDKINWNPAPAAYEPYKQFLLEFIKKRLMGVPCEEETKVIHDFYMDRERKEYEVDIIFPIKEYIDDMWTDPNGKYDYAIWGLTGIAELIIEYIDQHYKNARLCHVYDSRRKLRLRGIMAQHPDNIVNYPEETVFVAAQAAAKPAKVFFDKIGRSKSTYASVSAQSVIEKF